MAEIKSTLDLVLEKTRGLRMTDEEKARMHDEAISQRANGLCRRYLDGRMEWPEVEGELDSANEADRSSMRKALYGHLVDSLTPSTLHSRALNAIDILSRGKARDSIKRLQDLLSGYLKARQKRQKRIRADLWEELARKGISGSAVDPNVEESPLWKAQEREIEREYRERLAELKERLRQTFNGS